MAKCECGHPESFHRVATEQTKKGGLASFADGIENAFGGKSEAWRVCLGETHSGKPCPCLRFIKG